MVDRQPLHAGRVHLEPVNGQQNTFDMTMADGATEQGTPLNKSTFLKDATAALYGLPNTAVPDDVFAWLGRYAEHCWRRRSLTQEINNIDVAQDYLIANNVSTIDALCSSSVALVNGEAVLVNPQEISAYGIGDFANYIVNNAPIYFSVNTFDSIFYIPTGATKGSTTEFTVRQTTGPKLYLPKDATVKAKIATVETTDYGEWELVFSTNRNAYPDSGIQDGYEYEYVGVPFDKLPTAPQIETGSYVGTGTYSSGSQNSLAIGFASKMIVIQGTDDLAVIIVPSGRGSSLINVNNCTIHALTASITGNVVKWYSTHTAEAQMNVSGQTYHYFAIG